MPAKNPRVNVVLEEPVYDGLVRLAKRTGTSLSQAARDLLREGLETHEDVILTGIAEGRAATFDRTSALTHLQVWGPDASGKRR